MKPTYGYTISSTCDSAVITHFVSCSDSRETLQQSARDFQAGKSSCRNNRNKPVDTLNLTILQTKWSKFWKNHSLNLLLVGGKKAE